MTHRNDQAEPYRIRLHLRASKQDSLSFFCLSADYNLKDNLILVRM